MNNAAVIIRAQVSIRAHVFIYLSFHFISLACTTESRIVGSYVNSTLTFSGIARLFSKAVAPYYIHTSNVGGFQFLHILDNPLLCYIVIFIIVILVGMKCYLICCALP